MKTVIVMLVLVAFCSDVWAAPAKAPAMRVCVDASGGMITRKKCKTTETQLNVEALAALLPTGPQGPAGIVNLPQCRLAEYDCSITVTANSTSACVYACDDGEFLLQYSAKPASVFVYPSGSELTGQYANGVATGIKITWYALQTITDSAHFQLVCCPTQ